jgi:aspartyl-tRNA(Asn)/glutamyl-tRNA(Gln) amidotransferase subunit C
MTIDDKKIEDLAHLARLEFDAKEKIAIKADLERILVFCDKLNEVDTENVKPLIYLSNEYNILRKDEARVGIDKDLALKNAPSADSDYFKVPKVVTK